MEQNEKPLDDVPFWTKDMIALAVLNIVLLAGIVFGLWMVLKGLTQPLGSWLEAKFTL